MKLNFSYPGTGFSKGAVLLKPAGGLAVHGAAFITYWIYVPDSIPAGFTVNVFAQDNVHYAWHVVVLKGSDIPAHTWYPVSINLAQLEITDTTFNLTTGNVFQTGIQFDTGTDTTVAWNDSVYVDNVALVGSTPTVVANFETTLNGFLNQRLAVSLTI